MIPPVTLPKSKDPLNSLPFSQFSFKQYILQKPTPPFQVAFFSTVLISKYGKQ